MSESGSDQKPVTAQKIRAVLKKGGHYSAAKSSAGYSVDEMRGVLHIREDDGLGRRSPEELAKAERSLRGYQETLKAAGIETELHTFEDARPHLTVKQPQAQQQ